MGVGISVTGSNMDDSRDIETALSDFISSFGVTTFKVSSENDNLDARISCN